MILWVHHILTVLLWTGLSYIQIFLYAFYSTSTGVDMDCTLPKWSGRAWRVQCIMATLISNRYIFVNFEDVQCCFFSHPYRQSLWMGLSIMRGQWGGSGLFMETFQWCNRMKIGMMVTFRISLIKCWLINLRNFKYISDWSFAFQAKRFSLKMI